MSDGRKNTPKLESADDDDDDDWVADLVANELMESQYDEFR